jgi:predicted nucleic acid-binding protein
VDEYAGRRLVFDDKAAYIYGSITAKRKHAGHPMETKDAMIAAICLSHGATLATRNVRDFEGLDLPLINPFEGL